MFKRHKILATLSLFALLLPPVFAQKSEFAVQYLSLNDAAPVIEASGDNTPTELRNLSGSNAGSIWDKWVRKSDAEIRNRLEQGDEDSIVNLLLFGTSFTKQPRLTEKEITKLARERSENAPQLFQAVLQRRLDDFVFALAKKQNQERLAFAKNHLVRKLRVDITTDNGKQASKSFLIKSVQRVFNESSGFASLIEQAKNNQEDVFIVRSQLFSRRGLSSDTSLKPNLAVENALRELKEKGMAIKVERVAIIGPGLDFTDKDDGYDFYAPQTIQPFAVIESLLKVGLADKRKLRVDTFDLSPKVNDHIKKFALRAKRGQDYRVHLPIDLDQKWSPEFIKYWEAFGQIIGKSARIAETESIPNTKDRVVDIRGEFLTKVNAFDTNIVLQRPSLDEKTRYDLIIGTNIFLYYNAFEQGLAMRNLDKMLSKGGLLLSNNALVEFPFTPIRSVGYSRTIYSQQASDADAIIWYQKQN